MTTNTIIQKLGADIIALEKEFERDASDATDHAERIASYQCAKLCRYLGDAICHSLTGYEVGDGPVEDLA